MKLEFRQTATTVRERACPVLRFVIVISWKIGLNVSRNPLVH